ncbi:GDP-mannose 4,6-dehydratase [Rhodocytophaga aerolata]|uniref:GDP-mannose 4,6-dehydratase n=1 Tax=Rhodocytophaga aerolata TaxID=455078 RepID=A0ABT8R885_9BACT|nr:NAD-dependent epimerase/dehydratase family protein [Rhodocytophaga aerolata]MDO1448311.1 GDP-mannose 4,6-dehydratase [Rhodocytophaga aerolata]
MSKKIVITGGAGFVGSSLAIYLKTTYSSYQIYALDNLKRKGAHLNLHRLADNGVIFVHGDIRNKEDFESFPQDIDFVIEASAEPSILAGMDGTPDYLINTNLVGTINCLNFAKKCKAGFIFLSTSRVYPIKKIEEIAYIEQNTRFALANKQQLPGISSLGINENFPLDGYRSLYGATKLASELLIQEYNHFYNLPTVINRCGVLTGPWQMGKVDQGVVVLWMAKHFWKQKLAYLGYEGTGKQVRDVLHIADLLQLIDYQLHNFHLINGEIFNVGGGEQVSVSLLELTGFAQAITGNKIPVDQVKENRQADIRIYITDHSKVTKVTGWQPQYTVEQIVEDIYNWIKDYKHQLETVLK